MAGLVGVPAFSGSAVATSHTSETLYLTDSGGDNAGNFLGKLFSVDLDDSVSPPRANLTLLTEFTDSDFGQTDAIAASPDGTTVYMVDKTSKHLGTYDVSSGSFTDVGEISGLPGGVVLAAYSPGGTLYVASQDDNKLYTIDPSDLTATEFVTVSGADVQGADIVFDAAGTLYLYSSGQETLYTVDYTSGSATFGQATEVGVTGDFFTGLAVRAAGTGDLVGSNTTRDEIVVVDKGDGSQGTAYEMYFDGSRYAYGYGDMTVGALETAKTCVDCTSGDALAKYEFECVATDEEGDCIEWDFVLEDDSDEYITYTSGSFTSKEDEMYEPISATFETEYCSLYALVKAGPVTSFGSVSFDGSEVTVSLTDEFVNEKNGKYYAISYVEFYCPETCVDFKAQGMPGEEVSTVGNLTIDAKTADGTTEILAPGKQPATYGAPNGANSLSNGCLDFETWGFANVEASGSDPQNFDFTFTNPVSSFSLRMLDYGDFNPERETHHKVSMVAFDSDDNMVDSQVLEHYTDGSVNPKKAWADAGKTTLLFDTLFEQGDACDAEAGEPGNYRWQVSGPGIERVELRFEGGYDPNLAFDDLCYSTDVSGSK